MQKNKVELLAPAGSFESLHAAIKAGADSIYFGVEQLNMRTRSSASFTIDDIKQVSSVCKKNNVEAYITLNTVMYDHDMQLLQTILKEVKKHKINAVIASDFAVMEYCNKIKIPVHVSTQSNVTNITSVKFFSSYADVIVLARELTLKQVEQITREIRSKRIKGVSGHTMKIEVFAHGALCMAVSGKCYLSLHSQNASANRGACIQNCRRPYKVTDIETKEELVIDNEYIMSPKDLCTIDILDQVVNAGINVLKIEGRSKGPEYVYTVTKCYREALQALYEGSYIKEKIEEWIKELETVYNRGFWEGYYLGRNLGEWTKHPGSAATQKKLYVGKASKYYPKIKVGEFIVEAGRIKKGDDVFIMSPKEGIVKETLKEMKVNGLDADEAGKGDKITFPCDMKITSKDKLYKVVETADA
jgi:U32 family peptidase